MQFRFGERLGGGAFGDVYEATNEIDIKYAVKIVRVSVNEISDALEHARALARARHPNIVRVIGVERVIDPSGGQEVDAVVMELLAGETLESRLHKSKARFNGSEIKVLGEQLLNGIEHIHAQGLTHGDLHQCNIMIDNNSLKIIDILYWGTLINLSSGSRADRIRRDLLSIQMILQDLMNFSDIGIGQINKFHSSLVDATKVSDIRTAFLNLFETSSSVTIEIAINSALQRLQDESFVENEAYAIAILEEIPMSSYYRLMQEVLVINNLRRKHCHFLRELLRRLTSNERQQIIGNNLARQIDQEVPNGNWSTAILLLEISDTEGWALLPAVTRIRLESAITHNILSGRKDIFGTKIYMNSNAGNLGTWALIFGTRFTDRDKLIDNIVQMLQNSWYTQNYIGDHLLALLPQLADTPGRQEKLISALVIAVNNDARTLVSNLGELPAQWQQVIQDRKVQ